jgi:FtsP/CotA-like multicopper oxidase with cupredoxin domain
MRQIGVVSVLALAAACGATPSLAAEPPSCQVLDNAFPQPGRAGGGENAYRPLPVFAPIRSQAGAPGTLSLSISVDHVSSSTAGYPGEVYVGNYQVTDIPVFRQQVGANTSLQVIRPEDGKVFGISNLCLNSPDFGFNGTQWSLVQGDTLDVMFQSRLDYVGNTDVNLPVNGGVPCRSSNLHTHGLLVSPYHPQKAGEGPYGDYVLDVTQPRHSFDFGTDTDNCGTQLGDIVHHNHGVTDLPLHYDTLIPGQPGVNSLASGEHPSGLFWYHAHPHGFSRQQISGGTTGAITIGALTDYACPEGDGQPGSCTITNANIRLMELKDAQLVAAGSGWGTIHGPESNLCAPTGGTRNGECQGTEGNTGPTKWVFTINGVEFPVAKVAAGKMEIWRIVNASQGMTYSLSLIEAGGTNGHAALPFQVLAKDGVSLAQPDGHAITRTQLLVMPASRVEIAIPAPANGGTYILHNSVAQTGDNGYGDIWPEVDLARFTWAKPDTQAQVEALQNPAPVKLASAATSTPIPHVEKIVQGQKGACTFVPGDKRVVYFLHRFVHTLGGGNGDTGGGKSGLLPQTNEVFGLIAGIQHANGSMDFYSDKGDPVLHDVKQVWSKGVHDGDLAFPAFGHNDWGTICTVKGNVESWQLINYTGEDHNFHIQQSKFTLDPNGEFQYPLPGLDAPKYTRETDAEVRDFSDPYVLSYNDTVPVPRGQSACAADPSSPGCNGKTTKECSGSPTDPACTRPGEVGIIMDFSRAEQVGTFVYHCHIMEHEDGGMMAMVRVLCPTGDASCASQVAQTAICKPSAND